MENDPATGCWILEQFEMRPEADCSVFYRVKKSMVDKLIDVYMYLVDDSFIGTLHELMAQRSVDRYLSLKIQCYIKMLV